MENLRFVFKGKIYNGKRWIYGELWRYIGSNSFKIIELEVN